MSLPEYVDEDREGVYLDAEEHVWVWDETQQRWWSPDGPLFELRTWEALSSAVGLRKATPAEQREIEQEMFS